MNFLYFLLLFSFIIFLARVVLPIVLAKKNWDSSLAKKRILPPISQEDSFTKIHVLIPLHQEQNIVNNLLQRISYLVAETSDNVLFYLLTSNREMPDDGVKTTYDHLNGFNWPNRVILLNSPEALFGKGALLNFGLKAIKSDSDDWIGVYDADSSPEVGVFSELLRNKHVDIFQQPSIYLGNFGDLSNLMKLLAAFQTIWCWGSEVQRYKRYTKELNSSRRIIRIPYLYPVSHGFFIKRKVIIDFGNFLNPYEDLRMGIPIVINNFQLEVSSFSDNCFFANDLTTWIKQTKNWMNGSWFILNDFKYLWRKAENNIIKRRIIILTIKGFISNLLWAFEGFLFIISFLFGIIFGTIDQKILSSVLYFSMCLIYGPVIIHLINKNILPQSNSNLGIWKSFFYAIIAPLLRSLGPFLCTIRLLFTGKFSEKEAFNVTPKVTPKMNLH